MDAKRLRIMFQAMDDGHRQILKEAISGLERERDRLQQVMRAGEAEYEQLEEEDRATSPRGEALDAVIARLSDALDELKLVTENVRDAAGAERAFHGKAPE